MFNFSIWFSVLGSVFLFTCASWHSTWAVLHSLCSPSGRNAHLAWRMHYWVLFRESWHLSSSILSELFFPIWSVHNHKLNNVFMWPLLVGENGCTMNVHSLKHLTTCVRNWGPLWAYSCFTFESFNGQLKARFHGTKSMNFQVTIIIIIVVDLT
jgi:hypothetical protein